MYSINSKISSTSCFVINQPSESEAVTELPLRVNAVLPVPDCVVPMLSASVVPTSFKNPSKLLPMEFIAMDDELPVDDEDIE